MTSCPAQPCISVLTSVSYLSRILRTEKVARLVLKRVVRTTLIHTGLETRSKTVTAMGKGKSPTKRYCEECGRIIESKRPGVTLCRNCENKLVNDFRSDESRQRRKDRKSARDMEESLFGGEPKPHRPRAGKDRLGEEDLYL